MNPVSRNSISLDEVNPIPKEHHVDIVSASRTQLARAPALNLPCRDLLDEGRREEYVKICLPLYLASREGDWKTAKDILDKHKELVRFSITKNCETALHVAVSRRKTKFVKNLVSLMENKDLELQDSSSYTTLCMAVSTGDVETANILLQKNKSLIDIPTSLGMTPLQMAASSGKSKKMVELLYKSSQSMEGDLWTTESRNSFLLSCVEADYFDVALKVLKDRPELALNGWGVLKVLAQKRQAFDRHPTKSSELAVYQLQQILPFRRYYLSQSRLLDKHPALQLLRSLLKIIAKLPWPEVYDLMRGPADPFNKDNAATNPMNEKKKYAPADPFNKDNAATNPMNEKKKYSSRVLFLAAEVGNIVFIVEIIRQYPELLTDVNDVNQSIFHVAISHRHVELYSLLNEIGGSIKDSIITLEDNNGNNMLHLVGSFTESAKNSYDYSQRPAQQMHREMLLFKEVESMLPLSLRIKKNAAGMTPHEEFINNHKVLVSDCEKWIKESGSQLIVVAALVVTISFAATITFPGGYNENGYPILNKRKILFPAFITFNSIAFASASVSMVYAFNLLSLRYAEVDIFWIFARRLSITVASFTVSLYATAMAFILNLFLLNEYGSPLLPKLIIGIITSVILCIPTGLTGETLNVVCDIFFGRRVFKGNLHYERDSMSSTRSPEQILFQNI